MHLYFIFFPLFLNKEKFYSFPSREFTFIDCLLYVGAGKNTLISTSDALRPSIFSQKVEKARPMREEMDGKVVCFPPWSAFFNFDVLLYKVLFPICTLT